MRSRFSARGTTGSTVEIVTVVLTSMLVTVEETATVVVDTVVAEFEMVIDEVTNAVDVTVGAVAVGVPVTVTTLAIAPKQSALLMAGFRAPARVPAI